MGIKNRSNPNKPSFISQTPFSSLSKKTMHKVCTIKKGVTNTICNSLIINVGPAGFEPATPCL